MKTAITGGAGGYYNSVGTSYNRIPKDVTEEVKNAQSRQKAAKDSAQSAMNDYVRSMRQTGNKSAFSRSRNNRADRVSKEQQDKITQMKRMIRGEDKKKQYGVGSIADSIQSYGQTLKASRESAKNTATKVKQLKYNFKDISGQIRRSKTSANAKQVASKARREVVMLKLKQQSGQYDDEEISAAITHAQAMERAAKKKARHLMEEEMIKITDDAPSQRDAINMEEQIEAERDKALEEIDKEMQALEEQLSDVSEEQMQEMQEAMEESMEEAQEMTQESMEDMTSEMLDEMSQAMQEMMEDTFSDLADSMFAITDFEMTEDDFKELVKKHRTSEDKDMVKADMEYLKAMFDRYNRMLRDAGSGGSASQSAMTSAASPMAMPVMSAEIGIPEGGIDVSV